jgi:hypothetical protein
MYVKFITVFVILTIVLIVIISYYSFGRAMIEVTPRVAAVTSDFIADIDTQNATPAPGILKGTLFTTDVSLTGSYEASGSKDVEGNVIGQVKLSNTTSYNQPLVATTRLLTVDKVLLRIKNRVDVPAGGSVTVDVYADDPSAFETLAPSKFTIPGLAENLQTQIYGESLVTLQSKPGSLKVVKAVDLVRAKDGLMKKAYDEAMNKFKTEFGPDYAAVVVDKKLVEEKLPVKVDDIADKFTLDQKFNVTLVGVKQGDVMETSASRLKQLVSGERELRAIKMENLTYVVQNYNSETKTANVKIHAEGETVLRSDSKILDKARLAGLNVRAVELYLTSFDEIESVKVSLTPFWVTKVPTLADHVTIVINNQ